MQEAVLSRTRKSTSLLGSPAGLFIGSARCILAKRTAYMRIRIMVDNLLEIAQISALENVCNNFLRKMLIKRIRGMPPAPAIFFYIKRSAFKKRQRKEFMYRIFI